MTKDAFKKKAMEYGYSEEDIEEFVDMIEEARNDGVPMQYEDIVLTEQAVY